MTKEQFIKIYDSLTIEEFKELIDNKMRCSECPFEKECDNDTTNNYCIDIIINGIKKFKEENAMNENNNTTKMKVVITDPDRDSIILNLNKDQYKLLDWLNYNGWFSERTNIDTIENFQEIDLA